MQKVTIYIDGANLYQGTKSRGGLDYARFFTRLQDKYSKLQIKTTGYELMGTYLMIDASQFTT